MFYNDEEIRVLPIRKSLTRPQLFCGCDRQLFFTLFTGCVALVFPGGMGSGNIFNVVLGIGLFLVGMQILVILAKYDPFISQIFTRSVRYQDSYIGSSLISCPDKKF